MAVSKQYSTAISKQSTKHKFIVCQASQLNPGRISQRKRKVQHRRKRKHKEK